MQDLIKSTAQYPLGAKSQKNQQYGIWPKNLLLFFCWRILNNTHELWVFDILWTDDQIIMDQRSHLQEKHKTFQFWKIGFFFIPPWINFWGRYWCNYCTLDLEKFWTSLFFFWVHFCVEFKSFIWFLLFFKVFFSHFH